MSAPVPVDGVNPYTQAYQSKQFDAGVVASSGRAVLDSLASPAASAVAAALVTPAEERADQIAHPQAGIATGY
jgi:hypothetical protein